MLLLIGFMLCALPIQAQKIKVTALKPAEYKNLMEQTANPCIVDIRAADEFEAGHISGAINLNADDFLFMRQLQNHCALSDTVMVYCKLGHTSKSVTDLMVKRGFLHVYHLKGGIVAWIRQYPTVSQY
ncbi:MAG: rhodanese-like domain-containing protein [Bacteroidetes bacterium]|nr:rhodanese-like domain-containing protein [Bacteroidota bacterium]